jgi:aldehyde:ferredoxin oxidoreductase
MIDWIGKTVYVDLGSESINVIRTDNKLIGKYLGGRGLGVYLLSELSGSDLDPLSQANPLIFTSGSLSGFAPMSSGAVLTSKSPLTGTVFSWNMGGGFGRELKKAGIDALIITGKAKKPVYVKVGEENAEILPAEGLWGKNIRSCTEALEGKGSVACIGRAGEKQVLISSFLVDSIHSGRGGLGAVAGSKMLKAVVVKGEKELSPANPERLEDLNTKMLKLFDASPVLSKGLANYGTPAFVKLLDYMNLIPSRNFSRTGTSFADMLSGEYIKAGFELEKEICPACPLGCKKRLKNTGQLLPDYDSLWAFGFNLENPDFSSILNADKICRDYGLDPISAGSVLGAYAELRSGIIESHELESLLMEIGEGSKMGDGARKYLFTREKENLSMDVKGLELGGFEPRGIRGQALAYATSCHGGDSLTAFMVGPEVLGKPLSLDRLSLKGKAGILQVFENLTAVLDSLVFCPFSIFVLNEETCSALLLSAADIEISPSELLKIGERIWNLERVYNLKAGFTQKDDTLPTRFFKDGSIGQVRTISEVRVIPSPEFETALREYYYYRGWDKDGVPLRRKLKELDIDY